MATFDVGDVILGKYEVTRVLGRGGMGVVVAARHLQLGELVALKFLHPAVRESKASAARFESEARTATRIKNEHVARVYDFGSADGTPFIVMEYLTGRDLAAEIRERGPLPVARAVDLLLQACEAIADAHNLGIIHRDLKPANLYLTTGSDGMPFVKVLDFGISKSLGTTGASVTASNAAVGSPLYMSPEQLAASKNVDARSDVWSLGVILYEMLTAATPFSGDSIATVGASVYKGLYTQPSAQRSDVPAGLEQAVADALTRDLEKRLPSVAAFAARIAPFGTDAARGSLERIERIAARAAQASPDATVAEGPPSAVREARSPSAGITPPPTAQSIADDPEPAPPRPSRRRVVALAAIGALAAATVVAGSLFVVKAGMSSASGQLAHSAPVWPVAAEDKGNLCKECRNDKCCMGKAACDESSACGDYLDCIRACNHEPGCKDRCIRRSPGGHAIAAPYLACIGSKCLASCAPESSAKTCSGCQLASCPEEMARCLSDPACDALYACLDACGPGNDACKQKCRTGQPSATQMACNAFTTCAMTYCADTCQP